MDYDLARLNMVNSQLRPNRVDDPRLLDAMGDVPRERFVPKALRGVAYADEDLPLPGGRHLIEPLVLARLLQAAQIVPEDVVLVIGCGSGYAAAVVARLAATCIVVEDDPALAREVEARLDDLGVDNVVVAVAEDLAGGHPSQAPYDVIVLAGSVARVPSAILEQIGAGGRLVTVIGEGRVGKATRFTRLHGVVGQRVICDARSPTCRGMESPPEFAF